MFNQMIKWTVILSLWRKYKSHLISSLTLLFILVLINIIHQDYLAYAESAQNKSVGWSFLVKWALYITSIGVYVWRITVINKARSFDSTLHKMMQAQKMPEKEVGEGTLVDSNKPDPFANIRGKKKLRSEADFLIEKDEQ